MLLKSGATEVINKVQDSLSPLWIAATKNHAGVVKCLLQYGATVDQTNAHGLTPIFMAAGGGYLEVVQYLVQAKAVLNTAGTFNVETGVQGKLSMPVLISSLLRSVLQAKQLPVAAFLIQSGAMDMTLEVDMLLTALDALLTMKESFELIKQFFSNSLYFAALFAKDRPTSEKSIAFLHLASRVGHLPLMEWLLSLGVAIDYKNSKGATAMSVALANNQSAAVMFLLSKGASVVDHGTSLWLYGIEKGLDDLVILAFDRGVSVNDSKKDVEGKIGTFPLIWAAFHGRIKVIAYLLDHGASINQCTEDGLTALFSAISNNQVAAVECLVKRGAWVNKIGVMSPLLGAVTKGNVQMVDYLLNANADPNFVASEAHGGVTPMWMAASNNQLEIIKRLESAGASLSQPNRGQDTYPIEVAASNGHEAIVEYLLSKEVIFDRANQTGNTPLLCAIQHAHLGVARLLVSKGAKLNCITATGENAFHAAVMSGNEEICLFVSEHYPNAVDINHANVKGITPLQFAVMLGYVGVVSILLRSGADMHCPLVDGNTILGMACALGHTLVVEQLIVAGANTTMVDKQGWAAIHHACTRGDTAIVNILLRYGVDVQQKVNGMTPLHMAAYNGHVIIVEQLLAAGADPASRNNKNKTPLDLARENNKIEIMKLLDSSLDIAEVSASLVDNTKKETTECSTREKISLMALIEQKKRELIDKTQIPELTAFMNAVKDGEEEKAKIMLVKNPKLLLAYAEIKDRGGHVFPRMTGFQYAVWALDWQMWDMMLPYFDNFPGEAKMQWEELEKGTPHGLYFNLQPLISALGTYVKDYAARTVSATRRINYWCTEVGGEQRKLPVSIVQEYCLVERGFIPVPDFRIRHERQINGDGEKKLEKALLKWYDKKGWYRGNTRKSALRTQYPPPGHEGVYSSRLITSDIAALTAYYQTRIEQRNELGARLNQINTNTMKIF